MGVQVKPYAHPDLVGYTGRFQTEGGVRIRRSCHTQGTDTERYVFRRHFEQIVAVLGALHEVNCHGSVTCSIKDGQFQISGEINLWYQPVSDAVIQGLRHISDYGWQAARISRQSSADIHAVVTKSLVRKVA